MKTLGLIYESANGRGAALLRARAERLYIMCLLPVQVDLAGGRGWVKGVVVADYDGVGMFVFHLGHLL